MLSVTCLSGDLPRLAALLRILRPVADEIVVADRRPRRSARCVGAATEHADRAVLVPYADRSSARCSGLDEQTNGDWVFRIDDDEVPSRALLAALAAPPEDVTHCFVPRPLPVGRRLARRLPVAARVAAAARAGATALAFPGLMHGPSRPGPGALPRRAALPPRPGQVGPGDEGGEGRALRGRCGPGLRCRARAERGELHPRVALAARRPRAGRGPRARPTPCATRPSSRSRPARLGTATRERDRRALGRPRARGRRLPGPARRQRHLPCRRGRVAVIDVVVTNLGTETWAWGRHGRPEIRLFLPSGSTTPSADAAARTTSAPGEMTTVPLSPVRAPDRPGRVAITVDLVHERHRWFDCARRTRSTCSSRRAPSCSSARRPATPPSTAGGRCPARASTVASSHCSSGRGRHGSRIASASRRRPCRPRGVPTRCTLVPAGSQTKPAPHRRSRRCACAAVAECRPRQREPRVSFAGSVLMRLLRIPKVRSHASREESPLDADRRDATTAASRTTGSAPAISTGARRRRARGAAQPSSAPGEPLWPDAPRGHPDEATIRRRRLIGLVVPCSARRLRDPRRRARVRRRSNDNSADDVPTTTAQQSVNPSSTDAARDLDHPEDDDDADRRRGHDGHADPRAARRSKSGDSATR